MYSGWDFFVNLDPDRKIWDKHKIYCVWRSAMTKLTNDIAVRVERIGAMNSFGIGVLKVLLTTFVYACIWTLLDPYGYSDDSPIDYLYLVRYSIHALATYFFLKVVFWVFRKKYPPLLSFSNIFIVLLSLWSLFYLIYIPYGPNLELFEYFRNL